MFPKLRFTLAVRFTWIVFVLMMLTGVAFLAIEYVETHVELDRSLERSSSIADEIYLPIDPQEARWLRLSDQAVRIIGPDGSILFEADTFARMRIPTSQPGFSTTRLGADTYRVYTTRLPAGGLLQLAALDRIGVAQLVAEARTFLLASIVVTLVTFGAGLYFARRSLAPAEQMFLRLQQFTNDASHELRTPLAVVNSELDLALRTRDYESRIRAAKSELLRGSEVVEGLLQLASLDSATLDSLPIDLSALAEGEVQRYERIAAEHQVTLTGSVDPEVSVRGDLHLAAQLIANLLDNAIKFTPPGGTVELSLSSTALAVRDTGPGVAAEDSDRIFERFYRSPSARSQTGHGLGLAIAARIVEVHGWRIRVSETPGGGATFTVSLKG